MKLRPCRCGPQHYERVQRQWWMRWFEGRRYYHCTNCKATLFLRREDARVVRPEPLA